MKEDAKQWIAMGALSEIVGQYDIAIQNFQQALKIDPHNADVWNSLGWTWARKGSPNDALRCFDRAISEDKQCTMAWVNKGIVLKNLGRYDDALFYYKQAINIPNSGPYDEKRVWYNLANLYWERGNPEDIKETKKCLSRALEIDPNYAHALRLLQLVTKGSKR
ncbi:Photosystem I assembly protein Ycf3 [subsurface metagenome]